MAPHNLICYRRYSLPSQRDEDQFLEIFILEDKFKEEVSKEFAGFNEEISWTKWMKLSRKENKQQQKYIRETQGQVAVL